MKSVESIKTLEGVTVLLRTSLNAPIEKGKVTDTFRLESALPTILYLQSRYAKVVLISHITGKGTETLRPVFNALSERVPNLSFCEYSIGPIARETIRRMVPGDVVMLENLRRHKGEQENSENFAQELAHLADVFVQDSFDVCHRPHASVVGVPALLPSYAGFTLLKEVEELRKARKPKKPSLAVVGGAKFSTKEPLIRCLLRMYDHVFVGGALANDFLQAQGYAIGVSVASLERQDAVKELLKNERLLLPVDAVVAESGAERTRARETSLKEIAPTEAIYDIGPHTIHALTELARKSKTVLWSGPLGFFEHGYHDGNRALAGAIPVGVQSVVGGGDTISALDAVKLTKRFSFVSTGGGAMLEFLTNGTLVGIEALT